MNGIYEKYGVKTRINAVGYATALGGSLMSQKVLDAMNEAAQSFVDMAELQAAASSRLAEYSGAEAGIVTSGAAGALTLGSAACLTGLDARKMDRLPDTEGIPNEIIMHCSHRCSYDHAIRASGAKIRSFGLNDIASKAGGRGIEAWEVEAAISPQTVALAFIASAQNMRDLETVVSATRKHHIPVLVDAAPLLPPAENIKRFIHAGATLVAFSGGKAIRGPQGAGFLVGTRDLITAAVLQQLDMGGCPETWNPPESLIPKSKLKGIPHHGIGRGLKVSKEEIIGLLVALEHFLGIDQAQVLASLEELLVKIEGDLSKIPHVNTKLLPVAVSGIRPLLELHFEEKALGMSAICISRTLKSGNPAIHLNERRIYEGILIVDPAGLRKQDCPAVAKAIRCIVEIAYKKRKQKRKV